ncbi:MAG TPA: hypothetical protein DEQ80_10985 [Anaerolinea thermolimosa]|uniref:EAL domain-containing protein n=1 Tax=Anaerolinea thermolimosa TaxID=229919 RepID=A0A3D1JIV8_9CHLR|nr:hypothetical protein [Anaerolinea thermolimosa]
MPDSSRVFLPVWQKVLLLFSGAYLFASVGMVWFVSQPDLKRLFSDILAPLGGLASAGVLFWVAWRLKRRSRRLGLAWAVFAAGVLMSGLGEVAWSVLEMTSGEIPFPSIADALYLCNYPLFLLGVLLYPRKPLRLAEAIQGILDAGVVILGGVVSIVMFVLTPLQQSLAGQSWFERVVSLAYPMGDILIFSVVIVLLYMQPADHRRLSLSLFAFGLLLYLAADLAFVFQSTAGVYQTGDFLDLLWNVAYLCFAWSGLHLLLPYKEKQAGLEVNSFLGRGLQHIALHWDNYLPYLWLFGGFALLIPSHKERIPVQFETLVAMIGGMIFLVMIRQILSLKDNIDLNRRLNHAMEMLSRQSMELVKANRELEKQIQVEMETKQQLSYAATHDHLTGLPNRTFLMDYLNIVLRQISSGSGETSALMFLDCDRFKLVNDSLGHIAGDELLVAVSQRIQKCLRSSDLVARLGGDEFVILLMNTSGLSGIETAARRIVEALSKPFTLKGQEVFIGASIGIVWNLSLYQNPEDVLRDADLAMYRAKERGRSCYVFFDPALRDRAIDHITLEADLRYALSRQQFELYYQPIVELCSERIVGFEALLRWNHPRRGLISPASFIPLAEQSGQILSIGEWALDEACRQFSSWLQAGLAPDESFVSVNISTAQFLDVHFHEIVRQTLLKYGLQSHHLKLEVTESVFLNNVDAVVHVFNRLEEMGVECMLDDFGTGYSSLGYLQHFSIKTLKIDQSFIWAIDHASRNNLISAIMAVARELNMQTIAEGIETTTQRDFLQRLGCTLAQGYLFYHPLKAGQVEGLLTQTQRTFPLSPYADPAGWAEPVD